MMLLWQKAMIALARSESITGWFQNSKFMSGFASQFVGGKDVAGSMACARDLKKWGATASLFYLGEYVDDPAKVRVTMEALTSVMEELGETDLDTHVSVDPTQVGSMIGWDECRKNIIELAGTVASNSGSGRDVLMLDMEDSSVTQPTLDLYWALREKNLPAAVTVQAYLHRTQDDLARLVKDGATIRLVKGAFAEPSSMAVTSRSDRDGAYRKAIVTMLSPEALETGVYPVFGTHDHSMVDFATHVARENGWNPDQWEIEMLLGVRPDYQRELVEQGVSLRLYLPFGRDWFPYSIRRVGENPKNAWFVLRSIVGGK